MPAAITSSCGHGAGWIAAEFLRHGGAVRLDDQFAQRAGMLVLTGHHIEQGSPSPLIATEPVENLSVEQMVAEKACRSVVQAIVAILAMAEAIGLTKRAVPWMPDRPLIAGLSQVCFVRAGVMVLFEVMAS